MTRSRLSNTSLQQHAIGTFAIGGIVTEYISGTTHYRVHSFTAAGTHKINFNNKTLIDFLIVAGGGGSAAAEGYTGSTGGAGAGGLVEGITQSIDPGSYTITVGVGGARSTSISAPGSTGGDSTFKGYTAKGGGAGSDYVGNDSERVGEAGGCGAGGSENSQTAGGTIQDNYSSVSGVTGYGNAGGNGGPYGGGGSGGSGGGGGAGGAGTTANSATANGGVGRANNIRTGANHTYCRGGNGYAHNESSNLYEIANSGNGAHGVSSTGGNQTNSGNGGSGIVEIRYAI